MTTDDLQKAGMRVRKANALTWRAAWILGIVFTLIFVGIAAVGFVLVRPCRGCKHPPHVERKCGVVVPVRAGGTVECVCEKDR